MERKTDLLKVANANYEEMSFNVKEHDIRTLNLPGSIRNMKEGITKLIFFYFGGYYAELAKKVQTRRYDDLKVKTAKVKKIENAKD